MYQEIEMDEDATVSVFGNKKVGSKLADAKPADIMSADKSTEIKTTKKKSANEKTPTHKEEDHTPAKDALDKKNRYRRIEFDGAYLQYLETSRDFDGRRTL